MGMDTEVDEDVELDDPANYRGGGRRHRDNPNDPKTAMLGWAKDRVLEHCPNLPPATATMLLKAEQRTVSSVLNSRSRHQVVEVMNSASIILLSEGVPEDLGDEILDFYTTPPA